MLPLPHEISYFLTQTGTPEEALKRRYSATRFTLLLNEITPSLHHIDSREVDLWLRAFLACLDTPSTLKGLRKAELIIGKILGEAFRHQKCAPSEAQAVYSALFSVLTSPPLAQDKRYDESPLQSESQLFTYHLAAFDPYTPLSAPANYVNRLCRLWGFRIHLGLREIVSDNGLDYETKKGYATSARFFFRLLRNLPGVPPSVLPAQADDLFQRHLDAFVAAAADPQNKCQWSSRTTKAHRKRLELLYSNQTSSAHPYVRARGIEDIDQFTETFDGEPTGDHNKRDGFGFTVVTFPIANNSDDRFPDPEVLELLHQQSRQGVCAKFPRISRKTEHRYILSQYSLWWDAQSLQRPDLRKLYRAIDALVCETPNHLGVSVYLLLLLFTGRPLKQAIHARIGKCTDLDRRTVDPSHDHVLFIDPAKQRLFFQHRFRSSFHDGRNEIWKPTWFWIALPVPDPLTVLFEQYVSWLKERELLSIDKPFFYVDYGEPRQMKPEDVRRILVRKLPHGSEDVTPARISQSFGPLFSHGFGLDEVSRRLITGRALGRTFAPISYTRLEWQELNERYKKCSLALHEYAKPERSSHEWWTRSAKQGAMKQSTKQPAAGSPLVMQEDAYKSLVKSLVTRVLLTSRQPRPQAIEHHNAYTCYAYLLLLRLGMRPTNKPGYLREDFQAAAEYLPIFDKNSGQHYEERLITVPRTVQYAIKQLAIGKTRLEQYLFFKRGPDKATRIPKELFFFLEPTGNPIPFTLAHFDEVLRELGAGEFVAVQRNIGRHSLRTMLWERSIPDDIIGAWFGHLQVGRGPLEIHSSTLLGPALRVISLQLEEALEIAGFKNLPYFAFEKPL
jgi:hypothetical protein